MKDLSIYLNDHLAGSVAAMEMLDDVIGSHEGKPLGKFLRGLRHDIEADQRELKALLDQLGIEESKMRKVGAWVAEKFSRGKLRAGDSGKPNLALMQSLESLALGIIGKRELWRTLAAVCESTSRLRGLDFSRLEKRAADQFERVEAEVLKIAPKIFAPELRSVRHEK